MAFDNTLISGSTATLILCLLGEKDMYGYEMIELLRQRDAAGLYPAGDFAEHLPL